MRSTTNLIDICYDCRSGIRNTAALGHLDVDGTTDQLLGLRTALDELFRAVTTRATGASSAASTTLESSEDAIDGLLVKCRNEVNELESALVKESGRKVLSGSSSLSAKAILGNLALSTSALRSVIGGGRQYVSSFLTPIQY